MFWGTWLLRSLSQFSCYHCSTPWNQLCYLHAQRSLLCSPASGWRTINEPRYKDRIPAFVQETLVVCTLNFCQQLGWDTWQFYNCSAASFWKKWFPETLCPDKKPAYLGGETYIWTWLVPQNLSIFWFFPKCAACQSLRGALEVTLPEQPASHLAVPRLGWFVPRNLLCVHCLWWIYEVQSDSRVW